MSSLGVRTGLAIDGPAFGRILRSSSPRITVEVLKLTTLLHHGYEPSAPQKVQSVEYEFFNGVWACGDYLNAWDDWVPDSGQHPRSGTGRAAMQADGFRRTS